MNKKINFWVQTVPSELYFDVNARLKTEIEKARATFKASYGEDATDLVLLPDPSGCGPRGYVTQGFLHEKLSEQGGVK